MQRITKADGNVVCFVNSTSQMETCSMCILLWLLLIIKLEHLWTTSPGFCKISWESCNLAIPHPYFEAATASVSDYTDYRVIHGGAFVFSGVFSSSFSLLLFFMVPHFHWIIQPSCVDLSAVMGTETEGTKHLYVSHLFLSPALVTHFPSSLSHSLLRRAKIPSTDWP